MTHLEPRSRYRAALPLGAAGLLALMLAGCVTPAQQNAANVQEDQGTCASMGARYGTQAHTDCMLQQQQRRDQEHMQFLEQARINSEMALNAQKMRDRQSR